MITLSNREPWMLAAACREVGVDVFFPDKGDDHVSPRRICHFTCTVRLQCLDYAMRLEGDLSRTKRSGIFGGFTPDQRAKYLEQWRAEQAEAAA